MSYRADDGRRYGKRAEASELDRQRAENNRLRARLERAELGGRLEHRRAQHNFERGEELYAEVERLRAEVNRLHDADRAPELTLAEIVGPELAEQEAARLRRERDDWKDAYYFVKRKEVRLRSQDNGLIRLLSAMLRQAEGQLREARGKVERLEEGIELYKDFTNQNHRVAQNYRHERDKWKARAQELGDQLHADANEAQLNYLRAEVHRLQRDEARGEVERLERRLEICIQQRQKWTAEAVDARHERDKARRWAVQGYRLMRAVERYAAATRWVRAREALRELVRRYREGRL